MPPVVWRTLFRPRLRRLYAAIRAKGLAVVTHCCGNCTELIPDLIEIGASMLNPMQPEAMDVDWVKKKYGRDIAFYGGMGVQGVIVTGTPDEVRRVARERLVTLGRGGGFVFGSGSSITADTPIENAIACVEVAMNQGG
jgi:uroporphyrinogen decarboxylase